MNDMDIEIEITYVSNVPHLASMRNISGLKWSTALVGITATDMWLPTNDGFDTVPLKSIEIVGREMPDYIVKQIQDVTMRNDVLAIDYKKKSSFSSAFVSYTMLFAGDSKNIMTLSNYLINLIGFKVDATFADLKPEESRLLCLIATGIDSFDMLGPIFDNNKEKLNHAFMVLKKKELVDDYASTTQLGVEYVEQIKGKEGGVIGNQTKDDLESDESERSSYITNTDPTTKMNRYLWEYDDSSIQGLVMTCELLQCIPIEDVDEVIIEDVKLSTKELQIHTKYDADIYIEPEDKSTIFTLRVVLNKDEDTSFRILCSIYLGVIKTDELARIFSLPRSLLERKLDYLKDEGYIHPDNKLSSDGMRHIMEMIYADNSDDNTSKLPIEENNEHSDDPSKNIIEMYETEKNNNDDLMNN